MRRKIKLFGLCFLITLSAVAFVFFMRELEARHRTTQGAIGNAAGQYHAIEITELQAVNSAVNTKPPIKEIPSAARGTVHYFADGCSQSDPTRANRQANWVCIFNPAKQAAKLKFTFYYEDRDPTYLDYDIPAECSKSIALYDRREVPHNRRFGAKIESSAPVVAQVCTAYYGKGDLKDWFTRAMHSVICADTLARVNLYADGMVIDRQGIRLREAEWAFLLNPNPATAKVNFFYVLQRWHEKDLRLGDPASAAFSIAP